MRDRGFDVLMAGVSVIAIIMFFMFVVRYGVDHSDKGCPCIQEESDVNAGRTVK